MARYIKEKIEDFSYKVKGKREEFEEWVQSERVQEVIRKAKVHLAIAKKHAKKLSAEIEKNEHYKQIRAKAAPHLKKIQQKAAEAKKAYQDKLAAKRLVQEKKEDTLNDEETEQALFDFLADKRSQERRLKAQNRGKDAVQKSLFEFASEGNIAGVEKALQENENRQYDDRGFSALHCAANSNRLNVVQFLLGNSHAKTDDRDRFACTALHRAAWNGHLEVVKYLLVKGGADPMAANFWKYTPFHYACEHGYLEVADFLLRTEGMDVMVLNAKNETGYDIICRKFRGNLKEDVEESLRLELMEHIELAHVEAQAIHGSHDKGSFEETELNNRLALIERHIAAHEAWLKSFEEEEVVVDELGPAILKAAKEGNIKWIDDQFAKPEARDAGSEYRDEDTGQSLLHLAVLQDNEDFLDILQDSTTLEPIDVDDQGNTSLHLAVMHGLVDMAELMIQAANDSGDEGGHALIAMENKDGKKAIDLICAKYQEEDMETLRAEIEYMLDPDKAQREADEDEIIRRYEEQVSLAKFYKASNVKYPKWIMDRKSEINAKLTGKWLAREKRRKEQAFKDARDARRAREKAERDDLMEGLKQAQLGAKKDFERGKQKLHDRIQTRVERLEKVLNSISTDIETTEFVDMQSKGFNTAIAHPMEEFMFPIEEANRNARSSAIKLWQKDIAKGKEAINKVWVEFEERVVRMETAAVESSGNGKLHAKIKAIRLQNATWMEKEVEVAKKLDNGLVIDRLVVITERDKMERLVPTQSPRSRRETIRQFKRIKYEIDVRERELLATKAQINVCATVENKRIAKLQFEESNVGAIRRLKRDIQLLWKEAKRAYSALTEDLQAYDEETKNVQQQLEVEEGIVEKKQAPLLWRRAQKDLCVEIREDLERRGRFRESFAMKFEDVTSDYDNRIWLKEQRYRAKRIKRTKLYRKSVKALQKEYFELGGHDIPEDQRTFDTDKSDSSSPEETSSSEEASSSGKSAEEKTDTASEEDESSSKSSDGSDSEDDT